MITVYRIIGAPALQAFIDAREAGAPVEELTRLMREAEAEKARNLQARPSVPKRRLHLVVDNEHLRAG
jgi:hypothetical protein